MCDRLRASFIESSFFGSRRFQAGLSYLPPLSVKPLRVAPAKPGVYLWELTQPCQRFSQDVVFSVPEEVFGGWIEENIRLGSVTVVQEAGDLE